MKAPVRTTVRLEEGLLEQARREAERRGETLTAFIEQGLRLMLAQSREHPARERVKLPVSDAGGGVLPGVDLDDSAALLDWMEFDTKDARQ